MRRRIVCMREECGGEGKGRGGGGVSAEGGEGKGRRVCECRGRCGGEEVGVVGVWVLRGGGGCGVQSTGPTPSLTKGRVLGPAPSLTKGRVLAPPPA